MTIHTTPDFEALKARMKDIWSAGDFGKIAKFTEAEAEKFIARRRIKPGIKVLDVACGTGNVTIPAAKVGAQVTGVDIAANLLDQARTRAKQADVAVQLDEGDAEELPFQDGSFDLVVSMFGVMFAPRPERAAAELIRVTKPKGHIALANWTPRGFVGEMIKLTAEHVTPSPGVPSPVLWGDEKTVHERLRDGTSDLQLKHYLAELKFPFSVAETIEFYKTYFGPTLKTFAALSEEAQEEYRDDMQELIALHNNATDGTVLIESEYLEVVATRK
jgi:ubiquinone/menaquinone biosynthesis C-methylase UbiE